MSKSAHAINGANDQAGRALLTVDIGSSSIRCTVYRMEDLSVVVGSSVAARLVEPISGRIALYHHTSDEACGRVSLFDYIDKVIDETISKLANTGQSWDVVGVGLASFVMNLLAVDDTGKPLRSELTLSYACSAEPIVKEVQALTSTLGEDIRKQLYERTGVPLHTAYAIPQLRYLYRQSMDPCEVCDTASICHWQTLASHCLARWMGQRIIPISFSEASWMGLLNFSTCQYEPSALALLPPLCQDALPELADYDTMPLLQEGIPTSSCYWDRWILLRNARFFLGLGDGACANVGSKCSSPDRIACTIGTSAAARVCLYSPIKESLSHLVPPGLFCYRINQSYILVGGALTDGGSIMEWMRGVFQLSDAKEGDNTIFQKCMDDVKTLSEKACQAAQTPSLRMIPFLSGERSTGFRPGATGALFGLTRDTTAAHIVLAGLEGITLRLRAVVQLIHKVIQATTTPTEEIYIVASGKALEVNDQWRQMIADSTGLDVILDTETLEATSRGVACLMRACIQQISTTSQSSPHTLCHEPIHSNFTRSIPRQHAYMFWEKAAWSQEEFIRALEPLFSSVVDTNEI